MRSCTSISETVPTLCRCTRRDDDGGPPTTTHPIIARACSFVLCVAQQQQQQHAAAAAPRNTKVHFPPLPHVALWAPPPPSCVPTWRCKRSCHVLLLHPYVCVFAPESLRVHETLPARQVVTHSITTQAHLPGSAQRYHSAVHFLFFPVSSRSRPLPWARVVVVV